MTTVDAWLGDLEARHLANLTRPELTRALRALSSCYVERRDKLTAGGALEGAGKRAAFALFYGPLHFLTVSAIVKAIGLDQKPPSSIADLGCGTGVGGAAWALACAQPPSIAGVDRNAWAVNEANWTYRELGLHARARTGDIVRDFPRFPSPPISKSPDSRLSDSQRPDSRLPNFQISQLSNAPALLLAYAVNELPADGRAMLLEKVADARGASLLIVEPIARRDRPWWPEWAARLTAAGAREDEWRFQSNLPASLRQIAKGAGLDPRELTARTISRL